MVVKRNKTMMTCGRRYGNPSGIEEGSDHWIRSNGYDTCSYCGGLSPDELFRLIDEGAEISPTDKSYKIYVGGTKKFYFQHLSVSERTRFIDLYNSHCIRMEYPGYFYVLPYFCRLEGEESCEPEIPLIMTV